jgi:chitosanase
MAMAGADRNFMTGMRRALVALAVLALGALPAAGADNGLTVVQKHRADQLISIFENGIPEIQYGYAEDLDDGRGITAGRAGFCTGTHDALAVIELYATLQPDAPILAYLPELRRLDTSDDPADTSGLDGYIEAWGEAAEDPLFREAQDAITDQEYYYPSVEHSDELGLQTALARAAVYDAIIQHGDGEDPDSLSSMLAQTEQRVGGTPATGVDEAEWLYAFLDVRREVLTNASDPETREEWAEAAGRPDVWEAIADSGNFDLDGPIRFSLGDYDVNIK